MMSLYQYENNIIRKQNEERVHVALNCMSAGCPVLPQKAFQGKTLNVELDNLAKFFFNELRNVRIDSAQKTVYLSEILSFYTEDFLAKDKTLNAYVNRFRREENKVPLDYKVKFTPYDWTIHNWHREKKMSLSSVIHSKIN